MQLYCVLDLTLMGQPSSGLLTEMCASVAYLCRSLHHIRNNLQHSCSIHLKARIELDVL